LVDYTNVPAKFDLEMYGGQPFVLDFVWPEDFDFTGENWAAQVRLEAPVGRGELVKDFDVSVDGNVVRVALDAEGVDQTGLKTSRMRWDLERHHSGAYSPDTVLAGTVRVVWDQTDGGGP
jgi:hypothetical protein